MYHVERDIAQVQHYRKNCPNILKGLCNKEVSTFQLLDIQIFYLGFQEACCQGHHHMENEIRSNPECWNCFEKHKISVDMDLSIGM